MRSPAIAVSAALCALLASPAWAEVYQCRSAGGAQRGVDVELDGNLLAIANGDKVRVYCGEGGVKDCPRMVDRGYTHVGEDGITMFEPGTTILSFAPWDGPRVEYRCKPADAATRKKFGK